MPFDIFAALKPNSTNYISFERSNSYFLGARSSKPWHNFEGKKSSIEIPILYFINGRLFGNERYAVYLCKPKGLVIYNNNVAKVEFVLLILL